MKTLIIVLFASISCYSQNFMMKMNVVEVYDNITIKSDSIKVIWGIDNMGSISLIWGTPEKMMYFKRKNKIASQKQREKLREMIEVYKLQPDNVESDRYIKVMSLFSDEKENIYLIKMIMNQGVMIYITRVDGRFPHYYFGMVHDKQKI
jgi:hypothetical protein